MPSASPPAAGDTTSTPGSKTTPAGDRLTAALPTSNAGAGRRRRWVFTTLAGSLALALIALAVLERLGLPDALIDLMAVGLLFALTLTLGLLSRTMRVSEFYVSGRRVPAFANGMALAGDAISGSIFIGLAGLFYLSGYAYAPASSPAASGQAIFACMLGWTGGFVLLALLFAPYLNRSGALTVPDFLAARYGGRGVRALAIAVTVAASFLLLSTQLALAGFISAHFLGIGYDLAVTAALILMLTCALAGGMRALTWTQGAHYIVLALAFLIPLAYVSLSLYGVPIPQFAFSDALADIRGLLAAAPESAATPGPGAFGATLFPDAAFLNAPTLALALMLGVASLPHLLARFFAAPSGRAARESAGWGLVFLVLVCTAAPLYMAFTQLEILTTAVGLAPDALPAWVMDLGNSGLVRICGAEAVSVEAIRAACFQLDPYHQLMQPGDFSLDIKAVVLALPEMAGMAGTASAFLAVGALAAVLSSANAHLLAIATTLSHDGFHKIAAPKATAARRLFAARLALIAAAAAAAFAAPAGPAGVATGVSWALALAAAGNFPALVLGIWWPRTTTRGAIAGMVAGLAVSLLCLLRPEIGLGGLWSVLAAVPAGFAIMIAVSLFTRQESAEGVLFLSQIRRRGGARAIRDTAV